jgi:hypothetical protein
LHRFAQAKFWQIHVRAIRDLIDSSDPSALETAGKKRTPVLDREQVLLKILD